MMDNKFIRYLVVMFFAFVADSLLCYYLPSSLLKINLTIVPYGAVAIYVFSSLCHRSFDNFCTRVCVIFFNVDIKYNTITRNNILN